MGQNAFSFLQYSSWDNRFFTERPPLFSTIQSKRSEWKKDQNKITFSQKSVSDAHAAYLLLSSLVKSWNMANTAQSSSEELKSWRKKTMGTVCGAFLRTWFTQSDFAKHSSVSSEIICRSLLPSFPLANFQGAETDLFQRRTSCSLDGEHLMEYK